MAASRIARGRWPVAVLGILCFLFVFFAVLMLSLPGGAVVSIVRSALAGAGLELTAGEGRYVFPFSLRVANAMIGPRGRNAVPVDAILAGWEPSGLLSWLPGHVRIDRGTAWVDVRTSPLPWHPGKVRVRLVGVGSDDLAPLLPAAAATWSFAIDSAEVVWQNFSSKNAVGRGTATLDRLVLPIPAQESPVREAEIKDVRLRFVIRGGTVQVSSLEGRYEDAAVEGNGEIVGFSTPSASRITFRLKIHNPLEGKVATLFNMVAKNAKNANLRITGTLLSPTGEFQFF
ncbi:MAG: hypothetical protein ACM3NF_11240 [Gemmatimonadota bacterium]